MECLHSSPIDFHGHLKSSNCLIDNRWVCKITDFGLRAIRIGDNGTDVGRKYSGKKWSRYQSWLVATTTMIEWYKRQYQLTRSRRDSHCLIWISPSGLLYTAPEILRQTNYSLGGSKPGDVYSFGIIMQEIVTLMGPYQEITTEQPEGKYITHQPWYKRKVAE